MTEMKKEMLIVAVIVLILASIPIYFIATKQYDKPSSTTVVETTLSSEAEKVCGIYQCQFFDGIAEREFTKSGNYIKRSYAENNKLKRISYGKWSIDNWKFHIVLDSCFDFDTSSLVSINRTVCTDMDTAYYLLSKNFTPNSIEFFENASTENPSIWLKWNKIL